MSKYEDIFSQSTIDALKGKSGESLRQMLGNKSVMQAAMRSQQLLNELNEAEEPYRDELEMVAIQICKDAYPIIEYANIKIDAKLVGMNDVNNSLDEIEINEVQQPFTPEYRRRIINGITHGAAVRGSFGFMLFREYLDQLDPSLINKYNEILKLVFGIYDDENAIAMFLQMIQQGHKMGGGSSKVIIGKGLNELRINNPNPLIKGEKYTVDNGAYHTIMTYDGIKNKKHKFTVYAPHLDNFIPWSYYVESKDLQDKVLKYIKEKNINEANKIFKKRFGHHYRVDTSGSMDEIQINKPFHKPKIGEVYIIMSKRHLPTDWKVENVGEYIILKNYDSFTTSTWSFDEWKARCDDGNIKLKTNPLQESQSNPQITIQARAICFPILVHEIIKGLYEILSLQGFQGDKQQNQDVVNKVDKLENEPHDLKYGKFIYDAISDIYNNSNHDDQRIREYLFTEIYKLPDAEFITFIENAINNKLTPKQKQWADGVMRDIESDLKADDAGVELDEIEISKPKAYIYNYTNKLIHPTKGETLLSWVNINGGRVEFVDNYNVKVIDKDKGISSIGGRNTKISKQNYQTSSPLFDMINYDEIRNTFNEKGWNRYDSQSEISAFYLPILKKRKQILEKYFDEHIGPGRVKVGYRTNELRLHTNVPLSKFII